MDARIGAGKEVCWSTCRDCSSSLHSYSLLPDSLHSDSLYSDSLLPDSLYSDSSRSKPSTFEEIRARTGGEYPGSDRSIPLSESFVLSRKPQIRLEELEAITGRE